MKTHGGIGQRIAAACIVAAGIAVVWGLVIGWIGILARTMLPATQGAADSLQITIDGTPVVATQTYETGEPLLVSRRTLDGKSWPLKYEQWLSSAYFHQPYEPPGIVDIPFTWDAHWSRIVGATDGKLPPTAWYLVSDGRPGGHLYLAGFDAFSKRSVGYIGREGFRASRPPLTEQFTLPAVVNHELLRMIFSTQSLRYRSIVRYHHLWDGGTPPEWYVYVLSPEQLWEIDLRERTSRSVAKFDGGMSLGYMIVAQSTFDQLEPITAATTAANASQEDEARPETADENSVDEDSETWKREALMAVREPDGVVVFDLDAGKRQRFRLPEQLLDRRFSAFLLSADQMLIFAHEQFDEYWSGGPITRLIWIDRQGNIQRVEQVKLAGSVPEPPERKAWRAAGVAPVSVVWLVGIPIGGPLYVLQKNYAGDYRSALALVAQFAWLPLVVVLAMGVALAWLTLRLQRKYRRPATAVWTAFVFLLGVPGFVAYWLEHRRPKLETCPECDQVVPRDRDACAACNEPFPPPAPVGTEIFA